ncbi:WXG100 family type VII secretion target [Metabacillus arenae]|uniref:ESAT-6-like protein n=1 Tax=Metabacillus arenae TaxID=2771434 RepID=A0A926S085_9BACI|nr:WXG100 family type VII secretion target [Metabacillus arenae]MBD1379774.1 WXG100 family type VII secretion target [Metabacillus arenae]
MPGEIRVTPAQLVDMANKYSTESNSVGEQITRLDSMISQLQGMWTGEASNAFAEQYESLKPSFIQMQTLLEEISTQLNSTSRALEDADQQIASQIRG